MTFYEKEKETWDKPQDEARLSLNLVNRAVVLRDRGDLDGAIALFKEQEQLCRKPHLRWHLAHSLMYQADVLCNRMNRPAEALPLAEESCRLATEHGYHSLTAKIQPILDTIRSRVG